MIDEEKLEESMLEQRKIYLKGRINKEQVAKIAKMLSWLDSQSVTEEIVMYINSKGGDSERGFDLYDIIKDVQAPIRGVVFREACSMAILALQACDVRVMSRHAVLGFHDIDIYLGTGWREFLDEAKKRVELAKKDQENYNNIITCRACSHFLDVEGVDSLCKKRKILSATEAKELNLIDEII